MQKLTLNETEDYDFSVILIMTSLEDYKLSFLINSNLKTHLTKQSDDFINDDRFSFSFYEYYNQLDDINYKLIKNKGLNNNQKEENNNQLFSVSRVRFLIPEYKKYDYILKIDPEIDVNLIQKTINNLYNVVSCKIIEVSKVKSLKNIQY